MSIPGTAGAIRSAKAQAAESRAFETLRMMEEGPAGVKANISKGMSQLEQINARLRQESGVANSNAFNTDAANSALMDYLSGKGSAQAAAEAFSKVAKEAIASGKLTAAEVSALQGYVGTTQMYVDAMALLGDNGIRIGTGGVAGSKVIKSAADVTYGQSSIDKAFSKHSSDFGTYPDGSKNSVELFKSDINKLIAAGEQKSGFYRGNEGTHIYDPITRQWVFINLDGTFNTAFKLGIEQFKYLIETGVVK